MRINDAEIVAGASCSGSFEPLLLGAGAGSSGHIRRTCEKSKKGAVHDKDYDVVSFGIAHDKGRGVVRGFGLNYCVNFVVIYFGTN
jgi:hypothetical protein